METADMGGPSDPSRPPGRAAGAPNSGEIPSDLPLGIRPFDRLPSIRAKLGSVIVFAVAVTILIMYVAIGFALRDAERQRQTQELNNEVERLANFALTRDGRVTRVFRLAIEEQPSPAVVLDPFGVRLAGTLPIPRTVDRVLAGSPDRGVIGRYQYSGQPVVRDRRIVGAVYLSRPVEGGGIAGATASAFDLVRRHWWQLLIGGAVAALIALVLARYLARGLTQPLRDMAQAAGRMARGDYQQRVDLRTRDEVGQLADAFNRMAGEMAGLERLRRDLVANVSHELKTPISALRAHLENLLDGVEQPNPAILHVMLQQSERLSRLVDQLLDLSRIESGDIPLKIEPVNVRSLVDSVAGEVELARPDRHLDVRNEVPASTPNVMADRERIHQVLFNLMDNAFRFTRSGGSVTVSANRVDGSCEVQVRDTGPGIPEEHLGLVFERFYRVDPSRSRDDGGTGIGLAIARSLVEAHGGRIWAEAPAGGGASIRFVLPLAEGGPPAPTGATASTRGDSANKPSLTVTSGGSG
jgi:signal transduction histidine kinase